MTSALAVLVNGLPGAGKTTLARALARDLGLPLLGKDVIKEAHADVLGSEREGWPQRRWNAAIGAAASETMWALLAEAPVGAVMESTWPADVRDFVVRGLRRPGQPPALEIWCEVPLETARRRFEARPPRHPIHGELLSDEEWDRWRDNARPLGLGATLRVDTTQPVDLGIVTAWIRDRWGPSGTGGGLPGPVGAFRDRWGPSGHGGLPGPRWPSGHGGRSVTMDEPNAVLARGAIRDDRRPRPPA